MQTSWNKEIKSFYLRREFNPPKDYLVTPTWPLFHCFVHHRDLRDDTGKWSILNTYLYFGCSLRDVLYCWRGDTDQIVMQIPRKWEWPSALPPSFVPLFYSDFYRQVMFDLRILSFYHRKPWQPPKKRNRQNSQGFNLRKDIIIRLSLFRTSLGGRLVGKVSLDPL